MRYGFALIFLASWFLPGAQPFRFTNYTSKNGLSNNSINCIIKDSRNFIWLGTEEGLNRFDGNRFMSFFNDQADKNTLCGNNVLDLLEYQPGQLLIGTNGGLSIFNTYTHQFENSKAVLPSAHEGPDNYVRSFFKDRQGRIFVNHSGVIDVFNESLQYLFRLTDLPWAQSLRGLLINKEAWFQDSKNRFWLPTDNNGLCIIDEAKKEVYSWKHNPLNYPFINREPVRSFLCDEETQVVWLATWGLGLARYDLTKNQFQRQLFNIIPGTEACCINSISRDKEGMLICGGGQAIYSVDPATLNYTFINGDPKVGAFPAFIGSSILNDGTYMWIGTETRGLLKLALNESNVQHVLLPYTIQDYTNFTTGITRSKNGDIYMAYRYDGLLDIAADGHNAKQYKLTDRTGSPESVTRICNDHADRLWVGTRAGFYIFDKQSKKFTQPPWLDPATRDLFINAMFCTSAGNLWIAFRYPNALGYYDLAGNKFSYYKNYLINGQPVFDSLYRISTLTEDEQHNIWMTSSAKGGMVCYEPAADRWKLYPTKPSKAALLKDQPVLNIVPGSGSDLWLSNEAGLGLIKYNYINDTVQFLTRKDGLLSDNIYAITRVGTNDLFFSCTAGINRLNISTNEVRTLQLKDENINLSFAYLQFYDSIGKQLVYGLNDRALFIKDAIWQTNASKQITFIDNIKVNNLPVPTAIGAQELQLGYSEKNISISFASASYSENGNLLYAYKLEGADNDWVTNTGQPVANYTSLAPGTYSFMVKAKDETSEWGPVNNSLLIVIAPPFWKTWWFVTMVMLLTGASVYLLFRSRVTMIRHEAGLKQRIAEAEMQALRAQMNPHFIFNCLNAIDNMIQTNQKELATTYLSRFARLIRGVLDSSKNNLVPLHKDVETLKLYLQLEQFRCNNKFEYSLTVDEELMHSDYKVPPLVVQPFLENAIHHGLLNKETDDRKLLITIELQDDDILYTITDNGVGRARAAFLKELNKPEHVSYGIQISKDRIQMHNRDEAKTSVAITDLFENDQPSGTRVEVTIKGSV
ncbi:MAG: two-component regulator propeller domain-containing protein [Chitinophagaceae bacterium]